MIAETLLMGSHALIRSHQFGLSLQISQETCLLKSQETYLLEIANSSISSTPPFDKLASTDPHETYMQLKFMFIKKKKKKNKHNMQNKRNNVTILPFIFVIVWTHALGPSPMPLRSPSS